MENKNNKKKLLELQGVTAGYNGHIVLENVNLTVYERDFLGIIGANGSGKTTLIKVLLGLVRPARGAVRFFFDSTDKPGRHIGYLPQETLFDKKFPITVQDVVLSGLVSKKGLLKSFSKEDKALAGQVLEQMGIPALKHRAIGTLSGGQMQRVYLARALVSSPALLVLDEPDTFVDQNFSRAFYEILLELNRRIAILLVSHDLGMISSHVKAIACVCRTLYYHNSNIITKQLLDSYNCPIDLITHGHLPHRVLPEHEGEERTGDAPHA
jgi:zinc transport system ATP-binding protein